MAALALVDVVKTYGAHPVIHGVNLTVGDGKFVVFVGPSGCGKSTLLRMIAGLEEISAGQVLIGGRVANNLSPKERNIAMVFQSYALYPQMTVAENMGFSLTLEKRPKSEVSAKVNEAAATLKLTELLDRRPSQLSGGQRQRVAIGRAIVRNPQVFLLDEPLSNLDAALRSETRVELSELHHRLGTTMIYVTHDQVEAMTMADKIVVLNKGRIEQVGSPMDLYNRPTNTFVATFIGSPKMNLVDGPWAQRFGSQTIGIRPEHIMVSNNEPTWKGTVSVIERLGSNTIMHVRVPGIGSLVANLDGQRDYVVGEDIGLKPDEQHLHFFDVSGRRMEAR
ncbi:ATP-binding cassette domain-containing protein [Rhizobium sp. BK418]|uniref:ABC transporter ATP-binding protein n=1 Tax=Rhizobium sp. BK418 TaxID=2512120 RepID=UPI0010489908|nr:ATP-binding cassette domain-containing protein [Rhizobium sp. BK418]TCR98802.1 carbohydrate ABC transporter ATP-binding protein (CUT1 family) [Rhizobium sp. BK418]